MAYDISKIQFLQGKSINALATGATKLGTTSGAYGKFIVTRVFIKPDSISGIAIIAPIINVGWTSATYADLVLASTVATTVVNTPTAVVIITGALAIPINTDVYVNVTTAGTGYSTYNFNIYIEGFYENI